MICQICLAEKSNYECPKCSIKYCSLNCYKSEKHCVCTEEFCKTNIDQYLKNLEASPESIKEMHQILQRDYEDRFEGVDFDDCNELFEKLTIEEKQAFTKVISSRMDLLIQPWSPWWITDEFVPKVGNVAVFRANPLVLPAILDFIYSYCATCRILNGDLEIQLFTETFLEISYIASQPKFIYDDFNQCLDYIVQGTLKNQSSESVLLFLKDLDIILDKQFEINALSHLQEILKGNIGKKCIYFKSLLKQTDESFQSIARLSISNFASKFKQSLETKPMIFIEPV